MFRERATRPQQLGPYELVRLLATGGMAEVYEARRPGPHGFSKRVALKRVLPQLATDERLLGMFCDEARIHAGLYHPNLVQVLDFGEHEGELYMAMELVDGPTCAEILEAMRARRRHVDLGVVLYIGQQVLRALDHVHHACDESGAPLCLVHRDVTPDNVLVGGAGEVKLGDFGIIRGIGIEARTAPGEVKGKIGYVSPEQAVGAPLDARSDLFSLGVTLAEMLIGGPLFPGRNELEVLQRLYAADLSMLRVHGSHIPPDVMAVITKTLARRPEDRFQTAWELGAELARCVERHPEGVDALAVVQWLRDMGIGEIKSGIHVEPSRSAQHPATAVAANEQSVSGVRPATLPGTESAVVYRMRRPGGTIVGPLELAQLLEMMATGRVGLDTQVSRNGGPFVPVSSMGELARFAARPAYRFFDAVAMRAHERWHIARATLPCVLLQLAQERRTGLLAAVDGRRQKRLYLADGSPQYVVSTEAGELLGSLLVADGLFSRGAMERALEQAHRSGRRLGETLVAEGVLRPSSLLAAVTNQRRKRVAELCRWRAGELYFVDGATSGEELSTAPREPLSLFADAVLAAWPADEIAHLLAPVRDVSLQRGRRAGGVLRLGLAPDAMRVLSLAQNGASPAALVSGLGRSGAASRATVLGALFVGLCSGAISLGQNAGVLTM